MDMQDDWVFSSSHNKEGFEVEEKPQREMIYDEAPFVNAITYEMSLMRKNYFR